MRTVTLVLVDPAGTVLGALPPFTVTLPYWQESGEIVAGARDAYGIEVAVLRLLHGDQPTARGGSVTYLAQTGTVPSTPLAAYPGELPDHPRRAPYARPGGPAESLAWAAAVLGDAGLGPVTGAAQQRTWNLSTIWRLTTPAGAVWLKQVPWFFAHEAAVLSWLNERGTGPRLIAGYDGRMLLADIPGEDLYEAPLPVRGAIAEDLHPIQLASMSTLDELAALGVPDKRGENLEEALLGVIAEHGGGDPRLAAIAADLPARLAELAACGVPETLVHGDLHPGNARGDHEHRTIIDWGDSFLGHPGFDILRLCEGRTPADTAVLTGAWVARWQAAAPGSDPARALELLRPLAALRNASVYAAFLDAIEPAEHPYHAADVPFWLTQATTP